MLTFSQEISRFSKKNDGPKSRSCCSKIDQVAGPEVARVPKHRDVKVAVQELIALNPTANTGYRRAPHLPRQSRIGA